MYNVKSVTELPNDTEPSAWLRIAIPTFRIVRHQAKTRAPKSNGALIEEWQNLFKDDFSRTAKAKVVLTDEEWRDYSRLIDLRAALYPATRH